MVTKTVKTDKKPLVGKVSSILSERALAVNIGSQHGVLRGMKFKVLADKPTEIYDPETNDMLGMIEREKVRLQASEVHEKFSVCRTYRKASDNVIRTGNGNLVSILPSLGEMVETLYAEDSAFIPPLPEEESYIKKGDRVVQILDDED